jgi:hypothetical protein
MNSHQRIAVMVIRIIALTIIAISLPAALINLIVAIDMGPAHSPPLLQNALWSFIYPISAFVFLILSKRLGYWTAGD